MSAPPVWEEPRGVTRKEVETEKWVLSGKKTTEANQGIYDIKQRVSRKLGFSDDQIRDPLVLKEGLVIISPYLQARK